MKQTRMMCWAVVAMVSLIPYVANAQAPAGSLPQGFSFDGVLQDSSGNPMSSPQSMNFKIYDSAGTCLLFEENQPSVVLAADGSFNLRVGTGSTVYMPSSGWASIFQNFASIPTGSGTCAGMYSPTAASSRKLRVTVGGVVLTDFDLGPVPMASSADTLQGKRAVDFIKVNTSGYSLSQTNIENVFSSTNYAKLINLLSGNQSSQILSNVSAPVSASDAATKGYADTSIAGKSLHASVSAPGNGQVLMWNASSSQWYASSASATDASKLPLVGGTMSGAIDMNGNHIMYTGHITMNPGSMIHMGNSTNSSEAAITGGFSVADKGKIWFNSDMNEMHFWDGSSVQALSVGVGSSGVISVAGRTGAVNLTAADISGLGSASSKNYGTAAGNLVELDGSGRIPSNVIVTAPSINRLLMTDAGSGSTIVESSCAINEVLKWTVSGWQCSSLGNVDPSMLKNGGNAMASPMVIGSNDNFSINVKTNNVTRMSIDNIGNVGIGTTVPNFTLDVSGRVHFMPMALPGGNAGEIAFDAGAGNAMKYHNGSTWMTVGNMQADGSMPFSGPVQVQAASASTPGISFVGDAGAGIYRSGAGAVAFTHAGAPSFIIAAGGLQAFGGGGAIRSGPGNSTWPTFHFASDLNTGIWNPGADVMAFGTNGIERMRIDLNGNIGIGTMAPSAKLEIAGNQPAPSMVVKNGSGSAPAMAIDGGGVSASYPALVIQNTAGGPSIKIGAAGTPIMNISNFVGLGCSWGGNIAATTSGVCTIGSGMLGGYVTNSNDTVVCSPQTPFPANFIHSCTIDGSGGVKITVFNTSGTSYAAPTSWNVHVTR